MAAHAEAAPRAGAPRWEPVTAGPRSRHAARRRAALLEKALGMEGEETQTGTSYWHWARLLGRVFNVDMATCSFCHRDSLRIIAAITHESVITRMLRHLKLASISPPIAPARCRQELFAFNEARTSVVRGEVRAPTVSFAPAWLDIPFAIVPSQLFRPGRPEALAHGIPSGFRLTHPGLHV